MPAENQTDAFTRAIEAKGWSLEQGGADPFDAAIEAKGWSLEPLGASGPEKVEEESDDTSAIGQAYRSFVTGITGTFASFPEALGIWAYNMERKYNPDAIRDEGGYLKPIEETEAFGTKYLNLYNVGQGIREATEYIVPDESKEYRGSFLASDVPQGLGSAVGFMVGGRGVGSVGRNMMGGSARITARHMSNIQKSGGVAGRKTQAPLMAREADRAAAFAKAAKTERNIQIAGVAATGMAVQMVEGWEDAYGTMLARARAEGRDRLTDRELDMAWSSYKWNAPGGAIEALGVNLMALKLFKNLDKGSNGIWGRSLHGMIRNGKMRERLIQTTKGAGMEAAQETAQTMWMNYTAAELAKYDKNRDLYEHVVRAGGAGGVVGAVFGLLTAGVARKARIQARIVEMNEEIHRLEMSGNTLSANAMRQELMSLQGELVTGTDESEMLKLIQEADAEFTEFHERSEAVKHEKDVALTSDDYIQNEDGTVSIPLGGGWTMTTTSKATMEQAAGMVPSEVEEGDVRVVDPELKKARREARQEVAELQLDIEEIEGREIISEDAANILGDTKVDLQAAKERLKELEAKWDTDRTIIQKGEVEVESKDVRFRVSAPTGTTFGEMSREEAQAFAEAQKAEREETEHPAHPRQAELEEQQRKYEENLERQRKARAAALTTQQEERYTGGTILVPVGAEETTGGIVEDGNKVRPDSDEVGRLTLKFEVIEDTEGKIAAAGPPQGGAGWVLVRDLNTGEEIVVNPNLYEVRNEAMDVEAILQSQGESGAVDLRPEREATELDTIIEGEQPPPQWTPGAIAAAKARGYINEDGFIMEGGHVEASDGKVVTELDVLRHSMTVRERGAEHRELVEKINEQAKAIRAHQTQGKVFPGKVQKLLDRLNSPDKVKERGGIVLDLETLIRAREILNTLIEMENAPKQARHANRREEAKAEFEEGLQRVNLLLNMMGREPVQGGRFSFPSFEGKGKFKADGPFTEQQLRAIHKYLKGSMRTREKVKGATRQANAAQAKRAGKAGEVTLSRRGGQAIKARKLVGAVNGKEYVMYEVPAKGKEGSVVVLPESDLIVESTGGMGTATLWVSGRSELEGVIETLEEVGSHDGYIITEIKPRRKGEKESEVVVHGAVDRPIKGAMPEVNKGSTFSVRGIRYRPAERDAPGQTARSKEHKYVQRQVSDGGLEIVDGVVQSRRTLPNPVGTSLLAQVSEGIEERRQRKAQEAKAKEESQERRIDEKRHALSVRRGKQKVVALEGANLKRAGEAKETIPVAEAFIDHVIDVMVGNFSGVEVHTVRMQFPEKAASEKEGDAVWVNAAHPGVIFVNPKVLRKHYKLVDGKLVGKKENQRSIESVVDEELVHLLDLQVIRHVLTDLRINPKGMKHVSSYLAAIYSTLSTSQIEYIVGNYAPRTKTVGEPEGKLRGRFFSHPLTPEQVAMEALRMMRNERHAAQLETLAIARGDRLWHEYYKGVRSLIRKVMKSLGGRVKDEHGERDMPSALALHLEATEHFLRVEKLPDGSELVSYMKDAIPDVWQTGQLLKLSIPHSGGTEVSYYPNTKEGYDAALRLAEAAAANFEGRESDRVSPKDMISEVGGLVATDPGGMSTAGEEGRNRLTKMMAKSDALLRALAYYKLEGLDYDAALEKFKQAGWITDPNHIPEELSRGKADWGWYVRAVAFVEAERVWGENALDSTQSLRTRKSGRKADAIKEGDDLSQGYYSPGEHISEAISFYEAMIARHVMTEITGRFKVRRNEVNGVSGTGFGATTFHFDHAEEGRARAIDKAEEVMRLKLVLESPANSGLVAMARGKDPDDVLPSVLPSEGEQQQARDKLLMLAADRKLTDRQKAQALENVKDRKVDVRGEGKSPISVASMKGGKAGGKSYEYANAFGEYLNARNREGEQRMDAGRIYDADGNFSEEQLAKVLEEAADPSYSHSGTSQSNAKAYRFALAATLRNYTERMTDIGVSSVELPPSSFHTKEQAEAYIQSIEWSVEPQIIEEVVEGDEVLYSVEEQEITTEEGLVFMGEEEFSPDEKPMTEREADEAADKGYRKIDRRKQSRSTFRKRLPSEKTTSQRTVRKAVRAKEPSTTRWVVHGGSMEIIKNSSLYLTQEELMVVNAVLAPELDHGRTLESAAEVLDLLALNEGVVKELYDSSAIPTRPVYQYNTDGEKGVTRVHILNERREPISPKIIPGRTVLKGWMRDTLATGIKKLAAIDKLYSDSNGLTFGASMDESTSGIPEGAPVSVDEGKLGWRVLSPSEWATTDTLRKAGPRMAAVADKVDAYFNKEQELLGEYMNGYNVLRKGGVMMAGIDQHGNYRGLSDPKERKDQKRHNIDKVVPPGAFFYTKEQAMQHAEKHGWKKVSWTTTVEPLTRKQLSKAESEAAAYFSIRERSLPPGMGSAERAKAQRMYNLGVAEYFLHNKASEATRLLVAWQKNVGIETGNFLRDNNVKVFQPDKSKTGGKWVNVSILGSEHYPRVFSQQTWSLINDPQLNPDAYGRLLDSMVDNGNAKDREEAKRMLNSMMHGMMGLNDRTDTNDFMANMEKARQWRLPNEFYDTSIEAYIAYLRRFVTRAAQIHTFGQGIGKNGQKVPTALEAALESVEGQNNKKYIQGIIDTIYRLNQGRDTARDFLSRWGMTATTAAYLSGPLTAVRNSLFAMRANAESFGMWNSLLSSTKVLWQVITPNMKSLQSRVNKGEMDAIAEANALGMLKHDVLAGRDAVMWGDDDVKVGKDAKVSETLGKVRHWALVMNRKAEEFNRAITLLAARQHLRRAQELSRSAPNSDAFAKHLAALERAGIKPGQVKKLLMVDKDGHWNPDPQAMQDYLRKMVDEKQYGYNIRQHPLWMDEPTLRILFQFQKWGFQRARDYARNVWQPMRHSTVVTMPDGSKKKVRDVAPFLRSMFLMIGQGELYATLFRALFYDDERKEVVIPASAKQAETFAGYGARLQMDIIYDGGFGIFTDYISWLDPMDTRAARWKEMIPISAPVEDLAEDSVNMVRDVKNILTSDQNYDAKGEAVLGAVEKMVRRLPLMRAVGVPGTSWRGGIEHNVRRWLEIEDYESQVQQGQKDAKLVRAAARKFAKQQGYDEELVWSGGKVVHSEKRELYGQLNEALLAGDVEQARIIRDRLVEGMDELSRKKALTAIKASVRGKQPVLIDGKQASVKEQRQFLLWVKNELPDYEERIKTVHDRYWQTARRAQLK